MRAISTQGSKHVGAKLTEEIVWGCRIRAAAGEAKRALAREYGFPALRDAIIGKTRKHIPMPEQLNYEKWQSK